MNSADTARIVERIVATWPTGPRGFVWTEALADLNHAQAQGIYEFLRDHEERPPTVARFLAVYRSTTPDYGWQIPGDSGPPISLAEYLDRHPDDTTLAAVAGRQGLGRGGQLVMDAVMTELEPDDVADRAAADAAHQAAEQPDPPPTDLDAT